MEPIYLLDLASRKVSWLAARQAVVAGNIANANTPGYRARDLAPFKDVLAQTQLALVSTSSGHLPTNEAGALASAPREDSENLDVSESGNNVGLEQEMARSGDINREYALSTNIMKSFHSLLMASLKP